MTLQVGSSRGGFAGLVFGYQDATHFYLFDWKGKDQTGPDGTAEAGMSVNYASPTAASVGLVKKSQRIVASIPRWRLRVGRRSVIWQDARARSPPPGVARGIWRVPVVVDGHRTILVLKELRRP